MHEEIILYREELLKFNLTLEILADCAPKHTDTRRVALDTAETASRDEAIVSETYEKRRLPIRRVSRLSGVTEKIIAFPKKSGDKATGHKKIRRYIAAVAAALLIFVTALLTYGNSGQAYAMVSLDGRQSVQLTLDDKNIVKKAVSIDNSISNGELEDFVGKSLDELGRYFKERDLENERIIVGYAILKQASDEQKMAFHAYLEKLFGDNQAVYMEGTLEDIREAEFKQQTLGIYLAERLKEKGEWPKSEADDDIEASEADENEDENDVREEDEEDEENEEV